MTSILYKLSASAKSTAAHPLSLRSFWGARYRGGRKKDFCSVQLAAFDVSYKVPVEVGQISGEFE